MGGFEGGEDVLLPAADGGQTILQRRSHGWMDEWINGWRVCVCVLKAFVTLLTSVFAIRLSIASCMSRLLSRSLLASVSVTAIRRSTRSHISPSSPSSLSATADGSLPGRASPSDRSCIRERA